jgi:Serpin (serine protease inhibitor)
MQQNLLDNEEENFIFSPLSAALSLSLVTYGAKGRTKEILTDLLIGNDAGVSIDEFLRWVLRIQRKIQVFTVFINFKKLGQKCPKDGSTSLNLIFIQIREYFSSNSGSFLFIPFCAGNFLSPTAFGHCPFGQFPVDAFWRWEFRPMEGHLEIIS